ncbi:hypothetical protein [Chryseobacterium sp. 18068]|uniref:hypothetical protein n=1 Tax=Chryseobacterium sp. 18068 TaxID=2681414 RepID=UPI00135CB03B|nr:hypothetical protein [Chryseobacterium sp. 18068]
MKDLINKKRNLTEEEFITAFEEILIEHYHKQDYVGAREYVFSMSEDDREKFNKKFVSGHSNELLQRHFTDFENVNQEEFKESVFKVTGKVDNIFVPPVLYENNIFQFTNHSFKNKTTGDTLYLLSDINNNQFFLRHSFIKNSDKSKDTNTLVNLLDSKEFNSTEFTNQYSLQLISDITDVAQVLKDLYNPNFDKSIVQEKLNTKTKAEKKDIGDVTLKIVLHSHLTDAIIELQNQNPDLVESRLDFCKHLINKYGDLDMGIKEVDLDNLWIKVWESKNKIENIIINDNANDTKKLPGLLTVEKAEENFRKGDWGINEILDEKGDLLLRLQELGHTKDNYLVQFPEDDIFAKYKTLEPAVNRFNEIVTEKGLQNALISYNETDYSNDPQYKHEVIEREKKAHRVEREIESFLDSINPKGDVKEYPKEILNKILILQYNQKGLYDLESIENNKLSSCNWGATVQGEEFWKEVLETNNFDRFFERYPENKFSNEHINNKSLNR